MKSRSLENASDMRPSDREEVRLGATLGTVNLLLRLEGALALAVAVITFRQTGASWWLFAGMFLLPDASMLGYLSDPKVGARMYNAGHTYFAPASLAVAGSMLGLPALFVPALIWAAHIGFDRLMGFGLKYPSAFKATHLGSGSIAARTNKGRCECAVSEIRF